MIPRFNLSYALKDLRTALTISGLNPEENNRASFLPGFDRSNFMIPTYRGREALYLILKTLPIPFKARIGVPLYACSVIAKTVAEAGMIPVFLDADPKTFGLSLHDLEKKADHLDCLILVHIFGYPAEFESFSKVMKGKPIIEDCAHAVGSFYHGQPLGSLSGVSFFSFGFFKPFNIGGGGCVVTKDKSLAGKINDMISSAKEETFPQALVNACKNYLYALAWRKTTYTIISFIRSCLNREYDNIRENESTTSYVISEPYKMRKSDLSVLLSRAKSFPHAPEIDNDYWFKLRNRLPERWHCPQEPDYGRWNHFIFPVIAETPEACEETINQLRNMGVGAARLYPDRTTFAKSLGYCGDCPESERISSIIFMLPSHASLSATDRNRILHSIEKIR